MKVFNIVVLSLGLCFSFSACAKKSGGKKGASTTPVSTSNTPSVTTPSNTTTPVPTVATVQGIPCTHGGMTSGIGGILGNIGGNNNNTNNTNVNTLTYSIDAAKTQLQITANNGSTTGVSQETYSLTPKLVNVLSNVIPGEQRTVVPLNSTVSNTTGATGTARFLAVGSRVILSGIPSTLNPTLMTVPLTLTCTGIQ